MMLEAARKHKECSELEDLFIFGPTPRPEANWGFGIAGMLAIKRNGVFKPIRQSKFEGGYLRLDGR